MFAVVKTGGKQYRISKDRVFCVEKIEAEEGSVVELEDVLMVSEGENIKVGSPYVVGAKVLIEILKQTRDKKILVFKKIRRHKYRRKNGHRQYISVVKVKDIVFG